VVSSVALAASSIAAFANVSPGVFVTSLTFFIWTSLLLGGAATIFGPVIGAIIFWVLQAFLANFLSQLALSWHSPGFDHPGLNPEIRAGWSGVDAAGHISTAGYFRRQEGVDLCQVTKSHKSTGSSHRRCCTWLQPRKTRCWSSTT
jgi:hypothetical protein